MHAPKAFLLFLAALVYLKRILPLLETQPSLRRPRIALHGRREVGPFRCKDVVVFVIRLISIPAAHGCSIPFSWNLLNQPSKERLSARNEDKVPAPCRPGRGRKLCSSSHSIFTPLPSLVQTRLKRPSQSKEGSPCDEHRGCTVLFMMHTCCK